MYGPKRVNKPLRVICDINELPIICDSAEAGLLIRQKPERVADLAKSGKLRGVKQGRSWYFRRDDLMEYISELFNPQAGGDDAPTHEQGEEISDTEESA